MGQTGNLKLELGEARNTRVNRPRRSTYYENRMNVIISRVLTVMIDVLLLLRRTVLIQHSTQRIAQATFYASQRPLMAAAYTR